MLQNVCLLCVLYIIQMILLFAIKLEALNTLSTSSDCSLKIKKKRNGTLNLKNFKVTIQKA